MVEFIKLSEDLYNEICSLLDIDPQTDRSTVEFLDSKLNLIEVENSYKKLSHLLSGRIAFIFGAGPSLPSAVNEIQTILTKYHEKIAVIAVDGATKALQEQNIPIDIIVSDLDGCIAAIKDEHASDTIIIVHAHGDNQDRVDHFLGTIENTVDIIGTSQSFETAKVRNLGGFTDGDRAAFLAANFNTRLIVLFAFDFGDIVGRYSKPDIMSEDVVASKRKLVKLDIAKKMLAKLVTDFPESKLYNCTPQGEEIPNIEKIGFRLLEKILKNQ